MQSNEGNDNDLVFVIEVCSNCKDHHWNTRHDQAKYQEYFNRGKSSLRFYLEPERREILSNLSLARRRILVADQFVCLKSVQRNC